MMTVKERLAALRRLMRERGIDAYLILTEDFHGSEYVGEYFKCRKYITGFTGSAGTALVLQDEACLWTDGRYFLQAEQQLEGSGITLMRMSSPGVPTLEEYLAAHIKEGQVLGVDGRTVPACVGQELCEQLKSIGARLEPGVDLAGELWEDRPAMSCKNVWILKERYAGESAAHKFGRVRKKLSERKATHLLLTSLDDIAWLLNLRGDDVACNPVFLSYLLIGQDGAVLYAQEKAFSEEVCKYLADTGVTLKEYGEIYCDITLPETYAGMEHESASGEGPVLMLDPVKVNYALRGKIPSFVSVIEETNPTAIMKACKNSVETACIRRAHIKDGVAVTRFIYWLKHSVGKEKITELSAAEKLEELRREEEGYIGPSFEPIIAYAQHGAIIHYSATPETDAVLRPEKMVLCDTGGQYLDGTTDITRTVVLGEISDREKEFFTRVLRGHLNLASARFLKGCSGINLDYLARQPLWEIGEDYNHGTGHGIGFVLNVHEGPNSFHYRSYPGRRPETPFEEGMVTSDEPGYYLPGEFGIRHENLILCKEAAITPVGTFMEFEYLTLVPFDREGILPEQMSEKEKQLLNEYHQKVYDTIGPFLEEPVRAWLAQQTQPV